MKLFKFNPVTSPTILEQGEPINNATSIMWVERYRDPGEFKIEAPLSSGLREFIPEGTLISHIDTYEVMVVENHQIEEPKREDPKLTITGRTFDSYLENRIVGVNLVRSSSTISEYVLDVDFTWNQLVQLINDHILTGHLVSSNDELDNVYASTILTGTSISEERTINRGPVIDAVQEILAIDDLGIRTIRRVPWAVPPGSSSSTVFDIFIGEDKTDQVVFSWKSGELESAAYLFSNKKLKNCALVLGRYVYRMVDTAAHKYDRRMMIVPADDLDGNLSAAPTGGALTTLLNKMDVRGRQALAKQSKITISQTDISDVTRYQYRRDYNVGDLVSLDGNFGQTTVMRVVEFAEIEDENGVSGHPTLSIPGV